VALRQIQLFEQGQRDISRTSGETLSQLSRALHCKIEDLLY
jgi:DNA-binding Xre family transcriptional regulator